MAISPKLIRLCITVGTSFLVGCIVSSNFHSSHLDCTLPPQPNFLNPTDYELIVLILSHAKNGNVRDTIRQTWLHNTAAASKHKWRHFFTIGSVGMSADTLLHLASEQSKYSDLIILPVLDTYPRLTSKLLQALVWLHNQTNVRYNMVLKVDDDAYVQVDHLLQEIEARSSSGWRTPPKSGHNREDGQTAANFQMNFGASLVKHLYWGYFIGNGAPRATGRWMEENWSLCDLFPPYAAGGGYMLSKSIVDYLVRNADDLRLYNNEDVSMGAWTVPLGNIERRHDIRFDSEYLSRGCKNDYFLKHKVDIAEMRKLDEYRTKTGTLCRHQYSVKAAYRYNWSAKPSNCCKRPQIH